MKLISLSIFSALLQVAICCFDKTGTLTSDNMTLIGLSGAPGAPPGLQKDVGSAPRESLRVLACCQALIQVDGDLVGDPLERAAFQAAGGSLCLVPSCLPLFVFCCNVLSGNV